MLEERASFGLVDVSASSNLGLLIRPFEKCTASHVCD